MGRIWCNPMSGKGGEEPDCSRSCSCAENMPAMQYHTLSKVMNYPDGATNPVRGGLVSPCLFLALGLPGRHLSLMETATNDS
jgi:hypothetical protein